jgi:putative endonuclease
MTAVGIYIYMLHCADGSCYVGSATGHDLSTRSDQHNAGLYPGYTLTRRPVVLVWSEYFDRITAELLSNGKSRVGAGPRTKH